MATTRTGQFPIGIRRGGSPWQKDLGALLEWLKPNGLEVIDLSRDADAHAADVVAAGARIGSVDLAVWQPMISADKAKRNEAVAQNAAYVEACAKAAGAINHMVVMMPEDPSASRADNFGYMVAAYGALAPTLEKNDARVVIEGWPGPGALCCTPETLRALFAEISTKSVGINFDPSHLIRMGIDPLRFLREFGDRVYHCHGKDCELSAEGLYEYGCEQPPALKKPRGFGSMHWRYTIPGHGQMSWTEGFRILKEAGYKGCVSIELEDADFNGSEEGEKLGFTGGGSFLAGC